MVNDMAHGRPDMAVTRILGSYGVACRWHLALSQEGHSVLGITPSRGVVHPRGSVDLFLRIWIGGGCAEGVTSRRSCRGAYSQFRGDLPLEQD